MEDRGCVCQPTFELVLDHRYPQRKSAASNFCCWLGEYSMRPFIRGTRKGAHPRPCGKQCEAQTKRSKNSDSQQCKRTASKGDRLCETHRNALNFERVQYYISVSTKTPKPKPHTDYNRYRNVAVAKLFNTVEDANTYMRINWNLIMAGVSNNHRVRSMSVASIRRK